MLPRLIRLSPRQTVIAARRFNSSNAGREGPLTGKGPKNAGRKGPLTGGGKEGSSSKEEPSKKKGSREESSDGSSKNPEKQSKNAELSESLKGAEASAAPRSVPGQGMEDKGGHAVPQGPGKDGQFAEQTKSTLEVAGAVDKAGSNEKEQKVDSKYWSDKKSE